MALSNLYADPNYHNLNHWGIIQVCSPVVLKDWVFLLFTCLTRCTFSHQALARKGIFVAEPADCSLTETVLIQTTPLKMVSRAKQFGGVDELRGRASVSQSK